MKTSLLLLGILLITFQGISQKVKIKDDIASVNGEEYMKWEKGPMGMEASIMALGSESDEIFISYQDYIDRNKISKSNPEGKVRWIELNFLTLGLKCEVASRTHKGLAKLIYQNEIYLDGALNRENAQNLVTKYGMKFTIIINN
ncbi:MAG: hypothetical protein ACI837_002987 [Crocinitomicaceae bacterium]|jgi:hypothetical protein